MIPVNSFNVKSLCELARSSSFFQKGSKSVKISSGTFKNIDLQTIDFTTRFRKCLRHFKDINNLEELLNSDYLLFLAKPNMDMETLNENRKIILKKITSKNLRDDLKRRKPKKVKSKHAAKRKKMNYNNPLLSLVNVNLEKIEEDVLNTPLLYVDFSSRVKNIIEIHSDLVCIRDLLHKKISFFLANRNFGVKSLKYLRDKLNSLLVSKKLSSKYKEIKKSSRIDEAIANKIKRIYKNNRNSDIVLKRIAYKRNNGLSYNRLGAIYGITRERIRQIIGGYFNSLIFKKTILDELKTVFKDYGYIINIDRFFSFLVKNNKWSDKNKIFFDKLLNLFKEEIIIENHFIISDEIKRNRIVLRIIGEVIKRQTKNKKDGISISYINDILAKKQGSWDLELKKLLIIDVYEYFCSKNRNYIIWRNKIYDRRSFKKGD